MDLTALHIIRHHDQCNQCYRRYSQPTNDEHRRFVISDKHDPISMPLCFSAVWQVEITRCDSTKVRCESTITRCEIAILISHYRIALSYYRIALSYYRIALSYYRIALSYYRIALSCLRPKSERDDDVKDDDVKEISKFKDVVRGWNTWVIIWIILNILRSIIMFHLSEEKHVPRVGRASNWI